MTPVKAAMMKAALSGLYHLRAHRPLAPYTQGAGVIFALHHVRPADAPEGRWQAIPEIADAFLEALLDQIEAEGLDVVSLDEAVERLWSGTANRFVCFTFEHGYRNTLLHAYPIFKRRGLPIAVYVSTDFPSGRNEPWWITLEQVLKQADEIELCRDRQLWRLPAQTVADKARAFNELKTWLCSIDEMAQRRIVRSLAERHDIDSIELCRPLLLSWDEIRTLAADPLVTVGAATRGHYAVAKLSWDSAASEMAGSTEAIARELGHTPAHFSFPYGDEMSARGRDFALAREIGFRTAVTARKGVLFPAHRRYLTALPRVFLGAELQSLRYTELCLSGAPFAFANGFQRVNAA
jgi:peptidoglycan/xylan/chitin deacetylase (PgdA/CDA1 family)